MKVSIMNELDQVSKALYLFEKFKDDFEYNALMHYKNNNFSYKFFNFLIGYTIDRINMYDTNMYYGTRFEYKGYRYYQIETAIEELSLWKTAILRKNEFHISEHAYGKFLKYVKLVENREELNL